MKQIFLLFISLYMVSFTAYSQEKDTTSTMKDLLNSVKPYGTFEYAVGASRLGAAVVEIILRIGLKGKWKFDESDKYYFFTTAAFRFYYN